MIAARYALCTLLDETAASTPWGGQGSWAKHSLLVLFHNEAWGGEKFFQLLSKLAENPAGNRDLLELMYACIALGFEGRYRVVQNGQAQLDVAARAPRAAPAPAGRRIRARSVAPLAGRRAARAGRSSRWCRYGSASRCAGSLLLAAYLGFSYALNTASDPVFAESNPSACRRLRRASPRRRRRRPSRGSGSSSPRKSPKVLSRSETSPVRA